MVVVIIIVTAVVVLVLIVVVIVVVVLSRAYHDISQIPPRNPSPPWSPQQWPISPQTTTNHHHYHLVSPPPPLPISSQVLNPPVKLQEEYDGAVEKGLMKVTTDVMGNRSYGVTLNIGLKEIDGWGYDHPCARLIISRIGE